MPKQRSLHLHTALTGYPTPSSASPMPLSPTTTGAASPHTFRTGSADSADGIRKRVCKACDRCRLKKSKCDGSNPCSRCKADNAICVFGERKKSHDKVYPKGYVEMLEQQQSQLVSGLQEMYRNLVAAKAWEGPSLAETNGQPLTHDILNALGLLEPKHDGSGEVEGFEEDCTKLQSRLLAEGAGYAHRRGSMSSDSDHSQHGQAQTKHRASPPISKPPGFRESFNFGSTLASPLSRSPAPQQKQSSFPPTQPSPLQHSSPFPNDPQFYTAQWSLPSMESAQDLIRSKFAMQAPDFNQRLDMFDHQYDETMFYDGGDNLGSLPMTSFPPQLPGAYAGSMPGVQQEYNPGLDPMDLEFAKFIQVTT